MVAQQTSHITRTLLWSCTLRSAQRVNVLLTCPSIKLQELGTNFKLWVETMLLHCIAVVFNTEVFFYWDWSVECTATSQFLAGFSLFLRSRNVLLCELHPWVWHRDSETPSISQMWHTCSNRCSLCFRRAEPNAHSVHYGNFIFTNFVHSKVCSIKVAQ